MPIPSRDPTNVSPGRQSSGDALKPFLVRQTDLLCAAGSERRHTWQSLRKLRLLLHRWHLLSLDAPTIATLWTAQIAGSVGLRLPTASLLAMFLAVWTLYAADRLLDARPLRSRNRGGRVPLPDAEFEPRHLFHHLHRRGFLVALIAVTSVLGTLLPSLPPAALRLDLLLGALLIGYFVVIHAVDGARLPKEIAVGLFFAAAVFIPTISRQPELRLKLAPAALLFAALCSFNCIAIYRWEHAHLLGREQAPLQVHLSRPHMATLWAVNRLVTIGCWLVALGLLAALRGGPGQLNYLAIAITAALLLMLDQSRHRLSPLTLRALADLALATPLVLWLITALVHTM